MLDCLRGSLVSGSFFSVTNIEDTANTQLCYTMHQRITIEEIRKASQSLRFMLSPFGTLFKTGAGHTFTQPSFFNKCFFELPQLTIE